MVRIVRKGPLPSPSEVTGHLVPAAAQAPTVALREPRPEGFPLLFTGDWELIEPAVAFLHEHFVQRAHTSDTLRTYAEVLYDWFETLEQNAIEWTDADATDLIAYRNRMMHEASGHTGRPYRVSTINHRVRGVLRFYQWAVQTHWLDTSPLIGGARRFAVARHPRPVRNGAVHSADHSLFILRQFESLPRPLVSEQARELLAALPPPYDLMARWQLYTGLRVSELLRLNLTDVTKRQASAASHHTIELLRKAGKSGYVIASANLLDETAGYIYGHRKAWLQRARRKRRPSEQPALFLSARGTPVSKNAYQRAVSRAGSACGFKATTHLLRATFACMLLARLERLAKQGVAINPLLVVKVLMAHEHIETTDRYLRAIAVDVCELRQVLDSLLSERQ
jgi:integrase/recombinase XerD